MSVNFETINEGMKHLRALKVNKFITLVNYLSDGSYRLKPSALPFKGAVYAFWWVGSISDFTNNNVNRDLMFKGPGGRCVNVNFSSKWIDKIQIDGKIPLYVGKTDNLMNRVSQHLQLKTKRSLIIGEAAVKIERKKTSNQVRDRIERMFITDEDVRNIVLNNIGLSYVILNGDDEAVNRFYLEDKAIGNLLPLFNIDIER